MMATSSSRKSISYTLYGLLISYIFAYRSISEAATALELLWLNYKLCIINRATFFSVFLKLHRDPEPPQLSLPENSRGQRNRRRFYRVKIRIILSHEKLLQKVWENNPKKSINLAIASCSL